MDSGNIDHTTKGQRPSTSRATECAPDQNNGTTAVRPGTEELTTFIKAQDVQRVLGCSRAIAYKHLRSAAGRSEGRGLLRVPIEVWEDYVSRTLAGPDRASRGLDLHGLEAELVAVIDALDHLRATLSRLRPIVPSVPCVPIRES